MYGEAWISEGEAGLLLDYMRCGLGIGNHTQQWPERTRSHLVALSRSQVAAPFLGPLPASASIMYPETLFLLRPPLSNMQVTRSLVVDAKTGASKTDDIRTSYGAAFGYVTWAPTSTHLPHLI